MSVRLEEIVMHEVNGSGGKCSICCEHDATATWRTMGQPIGVCERCALDVLPALIADAVFIPKDRGADSLKHKLGVAELAFWRAMALRLEGGQR
jgi:hypothetical protein